MINQRSFLISKLFVTVKLELPSTAAPLKKVITGAGFPPNTVQLTTPSAPPPTDCSIFSRGVATVMAILLPVGSDSRVKFQVAESSTLALPTFIVC